MRELGSLCVVVAKLERRIDGTGRSRRGPNLVVRPGKREDRQDENHRRQNRLPFVAPDHIRKNCIRDADDE